MKKQSDKIIGLLGPTNTGKTHVALQEMLKFESGIFGLPLRLLAREVYDKCVDRVGSEKVALITGEEKIIPGAAKYFICTVESMPKDKEVEFVAIDEIQMCADRERGHIFTERLLESRGSKLTMFLGSQVMEHIIRELVENVEFEPSVADVLGLGPEPQSPPPVPPGVCPPGVWPGCPGCGLSGVGASGSAVGSSN